MLTGKFFFETNSMKWKKF